MSKTNTKLNESDKIRRDLFALYTYYQSRKRMKKIYDSNGENYTPTVEILGEKYEVNSESDIRKIIADVGTGFNDGYNENKPQLFKSGSLYSKYKARLFLSIFFLILGVFELIVTFILIPSLGMGTLNILFLIVGVVSTAVGLPLTIITSKKRKSLKYSELSSNTELIEWEKRQKQIYQERIDNCHKGPYKGEFKKASTQLNNQLKGSSKLKSKSGILINSINKEIGVVKQNSTIPIFYADNEEAVELMLFLMLNKRADTVKELVNLYETTKFQQGLLQSVGNSTASLIKQNNAALLALIKTDKSINRLIDNINNLEITTTSYGVIV